MGKLRRHLRQLEAFQTKVDRHMATQIAEHADETGVPSCRKGCSNCCQQVVWAELLEAQQIADRFPKQVERARPKLEAQAALVDGMPDDPKLVARAWWEAQQWCAFLGSDGLCTIYPVRPMTCRVHFVTSHPSLCGRDPKDPTGPSYTINMLDAGGTRLGAPHEVTRLGASSRTDWKEERDGIVWWGTVPQIFRHLFALTQRSGSK